MIDSNNLWKTLDSKTLNTHYVLEVFGENCGYCKQFKPDWDKLAEEFNDNPDAEFDDIMISLMNGNKEKIAGQKYGVRAFPTLLYFVPGNGMYKYQFEGPRSYENVRNWILDCRRKEAGNKK